MSKGDVIVLGCGLIGTTIAVDFLESNSVSRVTVVDLSGDRLRSLQQRASKLSGIDAVSGSNAKLAEKLHTVQLDIVKQRDELVKLFQKSELGVGALPFGIAEESVQAANRGDTSNKATRANFMR